MAPVIRTRAVLVAAAVAAAGTIPFRVREPAARGGEGPDGVSRSIAWLEARLARDPDNTEVANHLASRYVLRFGASADLGDVRRAEALVRGTIGRRPDRAADLARLSGILLMQHEFAGALAAAESALAAGSASDEALGAYADAALALGRTDDALAAIERMRPASLQALVRRAQWLETTGRSAAAHAILDRVCHRLEGSAARPQVLAWCFTELGGSALRARGADAARRRYARANRVFPGYRGSEEGLADLALARGDLAEAERHYRRILSDAHPDLYLRMADVAAGRGRREEASRWEREFLRVAADSSAEALYAPSLVLYLSERDDPGTRVRAVGLAEREVARRPTTESWDLLAWARFQAGDLEAAIAAVRRASGRDPAGPVHARHRERILAAARALRGGTASGRPPAWDSGPAG